MKYFLKIWLFTVLFSPLIFLAVLIINKSMFVKYGEDGVVVWLLAVLIGAGFGLPCLLIFWLISKKIEKTKLTAIQEKLIYIATGIFLIGVAFLIMNWKVIEIISLGDAFWCMIYSAGLVVGSLIFKTDKKPDQLTDESFTKQKNG